MANADETLFLWINGWVGTLPLFDELMKLVVSDYLVPVIGTLVLLAFWVSGRGASGRERNQLMAFAAIFAVALASGAIEILNNFSFRDRPFINLEVALLFYEPTDSSFPANSAAASFAIAAAVWVVDRRLGTALLLLSGFYAFSRVYAGVHFPLDVIGGGLIGVAAVPIGYGIVSVVRPVLILAIKVGRILVIA